MSNNNNSLPSRNGFMAQHLHTSQPPTENEARCSICYVEWAEDSQNVVSITFNHVIPCYYHRDCIAAWFKAIGRNRGTRGTCPDHRIELFDPTLIGQTAWTPPVEWAAWTPPTVAITIDGHPFALDSPEDLEEYAQLVLLRLEDRVTENHWDMNTSLDYRDVEMARHGYQRVHDLQLAASMRVRQDQSTEYYGLADQITRMTQEYDTQFMEYMPDRIRNILTSVSDLREATLSLVSDWYEAVVDEIDNRSVILPDLTEVNSVDMSDLYHHAQDLLRYTRVSARICQPHESDIDVELRLLTLVRELEPEDNPQRMTPGYIAGSRVMPDDNSHLHTVSGFYDLARFRVEQHENLAADTSDPPSRQIADFLAEWGTRREHQLQFATIFSGHQNLGPEFLEMSQRLREYVRTADALFRDRAPALIEAAIASREELSTSWKHCQLDLEDSWRDVPDASVASFSSIAQMCKEASEILLRARLGRDDS